MDKYFSFINLEAKILHNEKVIAAGNLDNPKDRTLNMTTVVNRESEKNPKFLNDCLFKDKFQISYQTKIFGPFGEIELKGDLESKCENVLDILGALLAMGQRIGESF